MIFEKPNNLKKFSELPSQLVSITINEGKSQVVGGVLEKQNNVMTQ